MFGNGGNMLNYFENNEKFAGAKSLLKRGLSFSASGLSACGKLLFTALSSNVRKILFVTDSEQSALRYKNDLKVLFDKTSRLFSYKTTGFYDCTLPNLYDYSSQIETISSLESENIVIAPLKALLEKFPTREFLNENSITLNLDDETDTVELAAKLTQIGYKRAITVTDPGEFALRGDTVDIFAVGENPVRIEFWGDTITDLRLFNPETQRSIGKITEFTILPMSKFLKNSETDETILKNLKTSFPLLLKDFEDEEKDFLREKYEQICSELASGADFEGKDYFEGLAGNPLKTLIEQLPEDFTIIFDEYESLKSAYERLDKLETEKYFQNLKLPGTLPLKTLNHTTFKEFLNSLKGKHKVFSDNFINTEAEKTFEFETAAAPLFSANTEALAVYVDEYLKKGYKTIIATDYGKRVEEILSDYEIPFGENFGDGVLITGNIALPGSVLTDFETVILSDRELFNKRSAEISAAKKVYRKESVTDLTPGDYVVHDIHGIGIFVGMSKQTVDGMEKDYLTIEYAGKDKLYMPAEQINLLCPYRGAGAQRPPLSKMGGTDWANIKSKTKKSVEEVAFKLLNLYAKRETVEGFAFEPDTPWQFEMEESFPYTETPDQLKAINETKADMELPKPMDRLICGDVGFGKTEVALRAMFKAVMSGKQVAMIAPTTVLALQHYNVVKERLAPFPVKIEMFSRFKTKKEIKEGLEKLAAGEIDIAVGTHRLFKDDVYFKDLGLLVVDEEHKFGVKDKEKLKMLKKNIDILSMSATPIPRTLYMSLSGIRDMSVITTPPTERLPVKTFVGKFDEKTLKNAVNYELERDGQIFYLYNRVETINDFAAYLQKLVPTAKIAVAHGKTPNTELEKIMFDFRNGAYDILLCTAIIESGVDIKNANTMIIHDADRFGLAQLYQLRGRVGRYDRQAYCYCFYRKNKELTQDALKRLEAVKQFSSFGSGYQIALKDIEIRGIGNLLGTKQHGKMFAVGFDTYCSLLEDAVAELKNIKQTKLKSSVIDINVTAYIPDNRVGSKEQKMAEYRKLAAISSLNELDDIVAEWKDRFAKIEEPVENLIKLIRLRLCATRARIKFVRETGSVIRIYTDFSMPELRIIRSKLPANVAKLIKPTMLPKGCNEGTTALLLSAGSMNFDEIFNILTDLFYTVFKIISEYEKQ